jgi:hypothetical protein
MMNAPSGQGHVVKKSKFTEECIAFTFRQAELDMPVCWDVRGWPLRCTCR